MKIAIIGAGMAGLSAAHILRETHQVELFDKSRGVGGRMSTRYAGDYEFDHGAQYFTVTDPEFQALIDTHSRDGEAVRWDSHGLYLRNGGVEADRGRPRWVGAPRMNSVPKAMAKGLSIHLGQRIASVTGQAGNLRLTFEDGHQSDPYDRVICTAPAPQAAALLPTDSGLQPMLASVRMHACFALMVGLDSVFDPDWDSLRVHDLPVSWIARNSSKPGRTDRMTSLVVHAAPDWSDRYAEAERDWVQAELLSVASTLCEQPLETAPHIALHRWLYAYADEGVGQDCLINQDYGIICAGDWCVGGRVEGAYVSGRAAARAIL